MRTQLLAFLALALLVAALAIGNPFLSAGKQLRGTPATAPPAPAAPVLRAQPASLPASLAGFAQPAGEPALPTGRWAAGSAGLPRLVHGAPEPALVERELRGADGAMLWWLRDGRAVRLTADRTGLELVDAQSLR